MSTIIATALLAIGTFAAIALGIYLRIKSRQKDNDGVGLEVKFSHFDVIQVSDLYSTPPSVTVHQKKEKSGKVVTRKEYNIRETYDYERCFQ